MHIYTHKYVTYFNAVKLQILKMLQCKLKIISKLFSRIFLVQYLKCYSLSHNHLLKYPIQFSSFYFILALSQKTFPFSKSPFFPFASRLFFSQIFPEHRFSRLIPTISNIFTKPPKFVFPLDILFVIIHLLFVHKYLYIKITSASLDDIYVNYYVAAICVFVEY